MEEVRPDMISTLISIIHSKRAGTETVILRMRDENSTVIGSTCKSRIAVPEDKKKKTKKQQPDSISNVANSIVHVIEPTLKTKNFRGLAFWIKHMTSNRSIIAPPVAPAPLSR